MIVDRRDETPYPLDDLHAVYSKARYIGTLLGTAQHSFLCELLDSTRYALLSHSELERVAVVGRPVGDNDSWMRILNSGRSISTGHLITAPIARVAQLAGNGFRVPAGELYALLSPFGDGEAAGGLGNLDKGCNPLLFWDLTVIERIDLEDNMAIFPYAEGRCYAKR